MSLILRHFKILYRSAAEQLYLCAVVAHPSDPTATRSGLFAITVLTVAVRGADGWIDELKELFAPGFDEVLTLLAEESCPSRQASAF